MCVGDTDRDVGCGWSVVVPPSILIHVLTPQADNDLSAASRHITNIRSSSVDADYWRLNDRETERRVITDTRSQVHFFALTSSTRMLHFRIYRRIYAEMELFQR